MVTRSILRPVLRPVTRAVSDTIRGFNPRSLFASGEQGIWLDPSDFSTLFQDEAGTTPVTAEGQAAAKVLDKSGNGNHASIAAASAPTLGALSSGSRALSFNGTSQYLLANGLAPIFSGSNKQWTMHIAFSQEAAGGAALCALGKSDTANPYIWVQATTASTLRANLSMRTTAGAVVNQPIFTASKNAQAYTFRVNGAVVDAWANGVRIVTAGSAQSGAIDLDRFSLGALVRSSVSAYGKVKISEVIITNDVQSDATVAQVQRYMTARHADQLYSAGDTVDLFVITGQSNAEGRGSEGPAVPNGDAWFNQGASLKTLSDPVGNALTGSAWPAFANKYKELTGRKAVIVEAAYGGSALLAAASAANWSSTGTLRGVAVWAASDAITYLSAFNQLRYEKAFVIWCQGEQDATTYNGITVTDALYWVEMETLFNYFKANISGLDGILVSELGAHRDGTGEANWALIRAAQAAAVANVAGAHMAFSGAKNFPAQSKMSDTVHYTQAGYNDMGEALAIYAASLL
jgi:hypothetical protein